MGFKERKPEGEGRGERREYPVMLCLLLTVAESITFNIYGGMYVIRLQNQELRREGVPLGHICVESALGSLSPSLSTSSTPEKSVRHAAPRTPTPWTPRLSPPSPPSRPWPFPTQNFWPALWAAHHPTRHAPCRGCCDRGSRRVGDGPGAMCSARARRSRSSVQRCCASACSIGPRRVPSVPDSDTLRRPDGDGARRCPHRPNCDGVRRVKPISDGS
jgi:hypothetical protein